MNWPWKKQGALERKKKEEDDKIELHSARLKGEELLEKFTKTIDELGIVADDKSGNS